MNWSRGADDATSTAQDVPLRRPARPARCHVEAIDPGIARHHAGVERADVDAQFERVGRDDSADAAFAQAALDFAAFAGKIAAAIAANRLGAARLRLDSPAANT